MAAASCFSDADAALLFSPKVLFYNDSYVDFIFYNVNWGRKWPGKIIMSVIFPTIFMSRLRSTAESCKAGTDLGIGKRGKCPSRAASRHGRWRCPHNIFSCIPQVGKARSGPSHDVDVKSVQRAPLFPLIYYCPIVYISFLFLTKYGPWY